jgi:hypothetical protein
METGVVAEDPAGNILVVSSVYTSVIFLSLPFYISFTLKGFT